MGFACGTITSETTAEGTGTKAYTGLGGQPLVIIFKGGEIETLDSDTNPINSWHGASDGVVDAAIKAATSGSTSNGKYTAAACVYVNEENGTDVCVATLDSFNADGFTLNYSVVPTAAVKIHYMAFWGDAVTNVDVDTFTTAATAAPTTFARTAPGFQPDWIFVIGRKDTRSGYSVGVSVGTGVGDEFGMGFRWRSANVNRYTSFNNESKLAVMADDSSTPEQQFSLSAFGASGYTLSKDVGGANATDFIVVSIKGGDFAVGNWASPTSGAPVDQTVSGLGFEPEGYYLQGADIVGDPTGNANGVPTFYGASDGTNEASLWHDTNGTTDEDHGMSATKVIQMRDQSANLVEDADHKTLDSGGFKVTYTTVDAAANGVMWWAFNGTAAVGGVANPWYYYAQH